MIYIDKAPAGGSAADKPARCVSKKLQTAVAVGTLTPVWRKRLVFPLPPPVGCEGRPPSTWAEFGVRVDVMDGDRFARDADCGTVRLSFAGIHATPAAPPPRWLPLQPKTPGERVRGQVCVRARFIPPDPELEAAARAEAAAAAAATAASTASADAAAAAEYDAPADDAVPPPPAHRGRGAAAGAPPTAPPTARHAAKGSGYGQAGGDDGAPGGSGSGGGGSGKSFLKRRSQQVSAKPVDWSHVRAKTVSHAEDHLVRHPVGAAPSGGGGGGGGATRGRADLGQGRSVVTMTKLSDFLPAAGGRDGWSGYPRAADDDDGSGDDGGGMPDMHEVRRGVRDAAPPPRGGGVAARRRDLESYTAAPDVSAYDAPAARRAMAVTGAAPVPPPPTAALHRYMNDMAGVNSILAAAVSSTGAPLESHLPRPRAPAAAPPPPPPPGLLEGDDFDGTAPSRLPAAAATPAWNRRSRGPSARASMDASAAYDAFPSALHGSAPPSPPGEERWTIAMPPAAAASRAPTTTHEFGSLTRAALAAATSGARFP